MKLATYNNGHRDGELLVVNRELTRAVSAKGIIPTLQAALDDWANVAPKLQELYQKLNNDKLNASFSFDIAQCKAPLPRAYQWADASAYVNHIELVRKARGAAMPDNFWHDPLMYQGGSDSFLGPYENIKVTNEAYGIDFEAEVAIITDDVPMGITVERANAHIKLLMLVNDVSLRNLIPDELAKGFGFFHSKPSSAFSGVAVTPDELEASWQGSKVHLPLISQINNRHFGHPNAGVDMTFSFSQLIAHAAKTRPLIAGTIIGSGTVSNTDRSVGSSCIVEKRMLEILEYGHPKTDYMHFGDTVTIEMFDENKQSIFGAIHQQVQQAQ